MQDWPLRSYLELRALPTSVASARRRARNVLSQWGMGALTDTVELLVSEIVTNAVRASRRTPSIRFWLTSDGHSVLIRVWDGNHRPPTWQNAGPDAEAGRGLLLIEALSARWGCAMTAGHGGKIVWAVCAQGTP
jgi:anti-sigma regulatory factor (Ser/Thr protein kinase)